MSSSKDAPLSPRSQLALSCFEELLDCAVADVASECHRIARPGLDRSVDAEEEELRVWAARAAEAGPPRRAGARAGSTCSARHTPPSPPMSSRRRVYELRSPCRRRPLRPAPREMHGQGFQQQVSKEMESGTGIWTSGQCRKEKKTTPTRAESSNENYKEQYSWAHEKQQASNGSAATSYSPYSTTANPNRASIPNGVTDGGSGDARGDYSNHAP